MTTGSRSDTQSGADDTVADAGEPADAHEPAGPEQGIARLMAQARPDTDLDELRALAGVKRGLFDQAARPVLLSRYVLLERIGAGGLGVVFAAYDPSLDRRVAIKLLQARALPVEDAEAARERLVREAQAIARLAHPNVVAVHDVGTYELEQPLEGVLPRGVFVVMELVPGDDLDAWVRARPRRWTEVLAVYLAAGRGLEAAHRAGLVHRDFKPGNVLVSQGGGRARARVLDFGLVRAHGSSDPEAASQRPDHAAPSRLDASLTRVGGVLGTPAYMAPEQHAGAPADARSDQYAFCVALWEALFRERPFRGADVNELAAAKRGGVPLAPASRVPQAIVRALRRGLQPQPEQRFAEMGELLEALAAVPRRRWLARRLAIAAVLVAALAAAIVLRPEQRPPCEGLDRLRDVVWNEPARAAIVERFAASQRPHAQASATAVVAALDDYTRAWSTARREACEAALVHRTRGEPEMNRAALCLDRDLAQAGELVALLRDADDATIDRAVDAVDALPPLSTCTEELAPVDADDGSADDEDGRELRRVLARADAQLEGGHYDDAVALAEAARRTAVRDGRVGVRASAELVLGRVHLRRGRHETGVELLHAAHASAERVGDEHVATMALLGLARHELDAARASDAAHLIDLIDAKLARHRLGDAVEFEAAYIRAILARLRGDTDDAVAAARDALDRALAHYPSGHSAIARAHGLLGTVLSERGDLVGAGEEYATARRLYEERLGPEHPHVADMFEDQAQLDEIAARHRDALAKHQRALEIRERSYGPEHSRVAMSLANLASVYESLGDLENARRYGMRAHAMLIATQGEHHPDTGAVLSNLANLALDERDPERALALARDATRILSESVGDDHPRTAYAIATEGIALTALRRYDDALARLQRARTILVTRAGVRHTALPIIDKALGEAELGAGRLPAAREHLERALAAMRVAGSDLGEAGATRAVLAAVVEASDPAAAARLWDEAEHDWLSGGRTAEAFAELRRSLLEPE